MQRIIVADLKTDHENLKVADLSCYRSVEAFPGHCHAGTSDALFPDPFMGSLAGIDVAEKARETGGRGPVSSLSHVVQIKTEDNLLRNALSFWLFSRSRKGGRA